VIGEVIGNYRIVAELGKGGMGLVYRAEHVQLGRPAALKMLLPQLSHDPGIVQRFFNEARAASAIDHPGIVEIYELGTHTDGRAYFVMALLKGESLAHRLQRGPLGSLDGASLVAQVVGVIAAAHARGIVHRDLKPDNIFLVPNELVSGGVQVKLLDFGIAKLADAQGSGLKTQTGALIGTPAYMSPEQCLGRSDLDHRTDLYAIGCILFDVLCGQPPFTSQHGTGALIAAHLRDPAPDPRTLDPHIPDALALITRRLLEKDPAARFQSAVELRTALVAAGAVAPTVIPQPAVEGITTASPSTRRYAGPEAYSATTAPTTAGGSAGQVVTTPSPAPSSKRVYWIVGALLVALGGVGLFAAVSHGGDDARSGMTTAASVPPTATAIRAPAPAMAPAPAPAPARAAPPDPAPPEPSIAEAECGPGQARSDDTRGHCCWPAQAWSSAKARCVGTPVCPPGQRVAKEQCIQIPVVAESPPASRVAASSTPRLSIDGTAYQPGSTIEIKFSAPMAAAPGNRAWIAIATPSLPPSSYGAWKFVDNGTRRITLNAPATAGDYEIRLFTEYPAKDYNVAQTARFTVDVRSTAVVTPRAQQRFALGASKTTPRATVEMTFPTSLNALPGEQFWVTIVKAGEPDASWGTYAYVRAGAKRTALQAPQDPGAYEVRLHANYPKQTTNVVFRAPLRVEPN
jgi:serine/threonine-protein kinase